jgi:hypothetical protein
LESAFDSGHEVLVTHFFFLSLGFHLSFERDSFESKKDEFAVHHLNGGRYFDWFAFRDFKAGW